MESTAKRRGGDAVPRAAVYARMEELQSQMEEQKRQLQSTVQVAQRVPQMVQEIADVMVVAGPCFRCKKPGHIANDCTLPREPRREPPTCFRCNKVGHISTRCKTRDVYCALCKNSKHVTEVCRRNSASVNANVGSMPVSQEEGAEVFKVSQKTTGSAFATATVSTSASGSTNFSRQIKVLVDTGNLLTIGMCISEAFYVSLGGQLRDLSPPSLHTANGASENSTMHGVGDTHVYIKCANFKDVMLSGPAVVLRGLN